MTGQCKPSEMPQEVYVYSEEGKNDKFSFGVRRVGDTEYVRKDIHAQLLAQRDELLAALRKMTVKSDDRYYAGINGNEDVTDIVATAIANAEKGE